MWDTEESGVSQRLQVTDLSFLRELSDVEKLKIDSPLLCQTWDDIGDCTVNTWLALPAPPEQYKIFHPNNISTEKIKWILRAIYFRVSKEQHNFSNWSGLQVVNLYQPELMTPALRVAYHIYRKRCLWARQFACKESLVWSKSEKELGMSLIVVSHRDE